MGQNEKTNFLLKNRAKIQSQSLLNAASNKKDKIKRKAAVPKQAEMDIISKNVEKKDYLSLNKKSAQEIQRKSQQNEQFRFVEKENYGKVPEYIIQRRLDQQELERKKKNSGRNEKNDGRRTVGNIANITK